MVRQYCCCSSNLKAAKILAIIFVICRVIQVGLFAQELANIDNIPHINEIDPETVDFFKLISKLNVGFSAVFLVVDLCLLVGTLKKVTGLLWFWLVMAAISIICNLAITIYISTLFINVLNIIMGVVSILVTIWVMLAVYGSIQEIMEETQAKSDF